MLIPTLVLKDPTALSSTQVQFQLLLMSFPAQLEPTALTTIYKQFHSAMIAQLESTVRLDLPSSQATAHKDIFALEVKRFPTL